jgi:hypothetical protein
MGLLLAVMVVLSIVELWVLFTVTDISGYGSVPAEANGLPNKDEAGAFIILNDDHNPLYEGNLLELLATTDPGVVDTTQGAHLLSKEIKSLLVQSYQLGDPNDYRVYRIGDPNTDVMKYDEQPGNTLLYITPQSGQWPPGNYLVDIPSEGAFGGRTYYEFFIDPDQ